MYVLMLTAKQRQFALNVVKGMTHADAYRGAYDCEGSSDAVVRDEAYRLMQHPEISQMVSERLERIERQFESDVPFNSSSAVSFLWKLAQDKRDEDARASIQAISVASKTLAEFKDGPQVQVDAVILDSEQLKALSQALLTAPQEPNA